MLDPADVLKLKCKFVEKMIEFVKKRKYIMNPCINCIYPYYVDSALADFLSECLSHSQECELEKKAGSYPDLPDTTIITECTDQLDLALSYTSQLGCRYSVSVKNALNGSAYPEVFLTDDSEYINVRANVIVSNNCNSTVETTTIQGGCVLEDCSNNYLGRYLFSTGFTAGANGANSVAEGNYLTKLRVYKTDNTGYLVNSPITLDLHPMSSPYYTDSVDCPGCATINPEDLLFGDINLTSAFSSLMDNVSLALFGESEDHNLSISYGTNNNVQINCIARHNPNGYWFGLNSSDLFVEVYNPNTTTTHTRNSIVASSIRSIRLQNDMSSEVPCDTIEYQVRTSTNDTGPYVANTSSFNKIILSSVYPDQPLYATGQTTANCDLYNLLATYDTGSPLISNVSWVYEDVISTSNAVTVTYTGTFTFNINTINGCQISDDLTIS